MISWTSTHLYGDIADDAKRTLLLVAYVRNLILENEGKHYSDPSADVAGYLLDAGIEDTKENIALVRTLESK
jgi:hypothetical protein